MDAEAQAFEPWQRAWEHGGLFVLPPREIAGACDVLRARHDPRSAAVFGAHVTLTSPFPRAPSQDDLEDLADRVAAATPFDLEVGPIDGPHPGAAFLVLPEAPLRALRDRLHAARIFDGVAHRGDQVPFHLTVAEFVNREQSWAIVTALRGTRLGRFRCVRVVHAAPDPAFRFSSRHTFALGR